MEDQSTLSLMAYTYVTAWTVNGGVNLSEQLSPQELHSSPKCKFLLTTDPDPHLIDADRGSAIGSLAFRAAFIGGVGADYDAELMSTIDKIRSARRTKDSKSTVLVAYGYGEAPVSLAHSGEKNGYVFVLEGADKESIRRAHKDELESMKLALGFEGTSLSSFVKIADGVHFKDSDKRTVYSIEFSLSGHANVSTGLSSDAITRISSRFSQINASPSLASVKRLYSQMAEYERDPLKAFLFGWSALEILISKAFSEYEAKFVSPLLDGPQKELRSRFLERTREVMSGKYRLMDKFVCVSAVLFPNATSEQALDRSESFGRIKETRDKMLHGREVVENELPVSGITNLLREYVIAYLAKRLPAETANDTKS
jgi:hypothetical protein